jgi:pimeloyl-ACP methyl ester carboxylesterase
MTELLIETDHTCAFFQSGTSDYLMITFGHMGKPGRRTFWGQGATEKLGISCIGLVPKHPHWYPVSDFEKILEAIGPILARYKEIVCYGFSMGGYAALKFSVQLKANHVLAFSPQASIDPNMLGVVDQRYIEFFNPELHAGMEIRPGECINGALVVCDPGFAVDMFHLGAIRAVASISAVPLPRVQHQTIDVVAATDRLKKVLHILRQGDNQAVCDLTKALAEFRDAPPAM